MDREYIIYNICDHFEFQDDIDLAWNQAMDFVIDYFRKYGMSVDELSDLICVINHLWKFCKYEKDKE